MGVSKVEDLPGYEDTTKSVEEFKQVNIENESEEL
jgi:hypothetical protein